MSGLKANKFDKEKLMEIFGKIAAYIVMVTVIIFVGAWAFQTLFAWFLVPLGLPAIGMAHAYGLMLVASFLKMKPKDLDLDENKKTKTTAETITNFYVYILFYLVAVGMGWITLLFM